MRETRIKMSAILFCAVLLGACVSEEANRSEAVKTTTGEGATTASPAASAKDRDIAFLRIVHAIPGAAAIDVATDKGTPFTGAIYKQITPYREVQSELQNIRVLPAGQTNTQSLAENREILVAGKHYTAIVVSNTDGKGVTLRVINDNLTPSSPGKAKVRVIHASPDAGVVDVYAKGNNNALFDGINYETFTSYTEVDPMTATLEVRPEGQQRAVLVIPNARFEAGKIYTVIVTGRAKATPKLEATIIQDELAGAVSSPTATPAAR